MAIVRWDPFRELSDMQDRMGRLLGDYYGRGGADDVMRRGAWIPPVDIFDSGKNELVIKAELPDMKREDIQLTVENSTLTISGEKKMDSEMHEEHCHRVERDLRHLLEVVLAAADRGCRQGIGRVQSWRSYREAADSRGSEAPADHCAGQRITRPA